MQFTHLHRTHQTNKIFIQLVPIQGALPRTKMVLQTYFLCIQFQNIFTLNLNSLVLHMNALTIHAMESFLIAQKCLHIHNKKFIDFIKSWQIKRLKHVKIERKLIEHWFRVNIFTLKLTYFKFLRFLKNCWIFSKSFYLDYKLNLNLMINSFTFQK